MQSVQTVKASPASRTVHGRAAVISIPERIDVERLEFREPKAGEVRIQIEGCGVCASNLALWKGKAWFEYPLEPGAPGHEGWGRIDAVGEDVTDLVPGARVALLSSHAFAEYDFANASEVVLLPAALDDVLVPAEPLGCAINIVKRSIIQRGEIVAIIGVGFLGTLLTQLVTNAGAQVIALSRRHSSLRLAEQFGAAAMVATKERQQAVQSVERLTRGRGCDCVIEAAGTQEALDLAAELTCERGRLVIAGYHQDGPRQVNMQLWNWRGLDVINAHERDPNVYVEGMREAVAAIENGLIDPSPLYTHTFKLDEISKAFDTIKHSPEGFIKALVIL